VSFQSRSANASHVLTPLPSRRCIDCFGQLCRLAKFLKALRSAHRYSIKATRVFFSTTGSQRAGTPFWEPTLALAGAVTLGQLVSHRRQELALAVEELESVWLAADGWLESLERGTLDIQRVLPPAALASLMCRLRLGASGRLGRIATWTLERQSETAGLLPGTALAGKRVGRHAPPGRDSVPNYVEHFLQELERQEHN
jgi:hypothetical protein